MEVVGVDGCGVETIGVDGCGVETIGVDGGGVVVCCGVDGVVVAVGSDIGVTTPL